MHPAAAGAVAVGLLLSTLWPVLAAAQLAISANDNTLTLVDGEPKVVAEPPANTISLIDLNVNPPALLGSIEVPTSVIGPPVSVAITPDESLALVTSGAKIDPGDPSRLVADDRVSVVDLRASPPALIAQIQAGAGAAGISISREGRLALVANRNDGTVSVLQIEGHSVRNIDTVRVAKAESGVAHVAIAPNGRTALVTRDGDHTISVLAIEADKVTYTGHDLGVGLKPYGIVIAPSGTEAVVANLGFGRGDNDTISLIDLTLEPPRAVETYTVGQTPEGLAISPDGRLVAVVIMNGSNRPKASAFYAPAGRVVLYRMNGGSLSRMADAYVGIWPQGAAFSRDGRTLLVQSMAERSIRVLRVGDDLGLTDTGQRIPLPGGGAALRTADQPLRLP